MAFSLSIYPWVHMAKFDGKAWDSQFIEKEHMTPEEEAALDDQSRAALAAKRNSFPELPLVNYSTQYGISCFEGLKAFPQVDGKLKLFRPDRNCARMTASMKGLRMPPIDDKILMDAIFGTVRKNASLGFPPRYNPEWEADSWQSGDTVYVRPFTYSEPGIGVDLSCEPWVITVCTTVSSYFKSESNDAIVSDRIRATPGGTGWMKTSANYLVSAMSKLEAEDAGYMEAIFLDATNRNLIEEGSSSCNFFALLPGDRLVTPALNDTILPGITRESVLKLAGHHGMNVEEREVSIIEVLDHAIECFVTGTAAGITPLSSLTYGNRTTDFASLEEGSVSMTLLKHLKGIQYGAAEDFFQWMFEVKIEA